MFVPRVLMALFTATETVPMEPFTTAPIVPTRVFTKLLHATTEIVLGIENRQLFIFTTESDAPEERFEANKVCYK